MKQTFKRIIVGVGGAIFVGLSLLNMQPYFALAKSAYGLIRWLPFVGFLTTQMIPIILAVMAASAFMLSRGKNKSGKGGTFQSVLIGTLIISVFALIILAFKIPEIAVSTFGILLWVVSTSFQTLPFWLKSFFFDEIVSVFRSHKKEESLSSDDDAVKELIEKRNAIPQNMLSASTIAALVANLVDILLGVWQAPIMTLENFIKLNFTLKTVSLEALRQVMMLSVLPELILATAMLGIYFCSIKANGNSRQQRRRQKNKGGFQPDFADQDDGFKGREDDYFNDFKDEPFERPKKRNGSGFNF